MIPFFSRRSILVLLVGLILGALGGLGYWAITPVDVETKMDWPPISFKGEPDVYESFLYIELINPGGEWTNVKNLQREGEYLVAKMKTSTFLEFLITEELKARGYSHTVEELDEMLRVRYDYSSDNPAIQIRAISTDENEAFFLAGVVPEAFRVYLTAEQFDEDLEDYQSAAEEFDFVSTALMEARSELDRFEGDGLDGLYLNQDYVITAAEVRVLERELDALSSELLSYAIDGFGEPKVLSRFIVGEPSEPEWVSPDRLRGRNAIVMGAVFGLAIGWVALNSRGLIDRLRPAPGIAVRLREEEEEEETEEGE